MQLFEKEILVPKIPGHKDLLVYLKKKLSDVLHKEGFFPIRMAVTDSVSSNNYKCEVGVLDQTGQKILVNKEAVSSSGPDVKHAFSNKVSINTEHTSAFLEIENLFKFRQRPYENTKKFNVVFLVPTGIGAEIGGHAGDATPVARLLADSCDTLITHPNVFNASDINEMPENSLYVEGSAICRVMMGAVGLQPVRSNRILVVIDTNKHKIFEHSAINSVNSARAVLGIDCVDIIHLDPSLSMNSEYSSSKRAVGRIDNINHLFSVLKKYTGNYSAIGISSIIQVPKHYHEDYFRGEGAIVNPWGGVEAMLTHAISYKLNVPSAHAPMFESPEIANMDPGIVDARMSAEAVSMSFFYCVLKGLHKSPKIITDDNVLYSDDIISAKDISCLVIPDGCLGLPTLSALEQGIKVIAVRENRNLMKNNLSELPWKEGQFFQADNYLSAVGILRSIKSGLSPSAVRRPFNTLKPSAYIKRFKIR